MEVRERCVAVVDILGFRERIRDGTLQEVAQLLDNLVSRIPRISSNWASSTFDRTGARSRSMSGRERMHKLLFSDTLFLWSDAMPESREKRKMRSEGFLMGVAYVIGGALLQGLPLRAGIAYGPVLVQARKRIIIGQPVVDAYLAEGVQEWVGGAIHESYPHDYHSLLDFAYQVPVKAGVPFELTRAIDWTLPTRVFDTEAEQGEKALPRLLRALELGIDNASSDRVRIKYTNAVAFVAAVSEYWERFNRSPK